MMKNSMKIRFLLGLVMALVFGVATYFSVLAGSSEQGDPPEGEICQTCHPALYLSWEMSSHGQALVDPIFQEIWDQRGKPRECLFCHTTGYDLKTNTWVADGITCQACHDPITADHPADPMPTDRSAALCEQCHSQTVFEWKLSVHRQSGLDCVDCHGQHSTSLRAEDTAHLCANCHRERASNFAHSSHSKQNLTCGDCHLKTLQADLSEEGGHSGMDHSFRPKLDACNECHKYQMHDPVEVHSDSGLGEIVIEEETPDFETQGLSIDPSPVSPISFALISALIGMVSGLLLSPLIQGWFIKFDLKAQSDNDSIGEK